MKEIKKKIGLPFFAGLLLYCSLAKAQDCPCRNVDMTQAEFSQDTLNYEKLFVKPFGGKKHTKWVYLPKNYFLFLDRFLDSTDYPGVRFHFVSHNKKLDHNQQFRDDQIMLMIEAGYRRDYRKFDTLYSFHKKVDILWNPNYNHVELSTRHKNGSSIIGPDHIILQDTSVIDNYKKQNKTNKYTKSVYVCEQQINQIKTFLNSNTGYNGVKLYFGSYNEKIECLDQGDVRQFTLILVPVENKDSKANFAKYLEFLKDKFLNEYYNHGSLCPNSCN